MRLKGYIHKLNPLSWRRATIKRALLLFYALGLPIYLYLGLQPAGATQSTTPTPLTATAELTTSTATDSTDQSTYPTLTIPSIGLTTPVQPLQPTASHELITPDNIAGSYGPHSNKVLIIGHSSTVFQSLTGLRIDAPIIYNGQAYHVIRREVTLKESISMERILQSEKDDIIVLMTCAGQSLPNRDATHRLIITAIADS